VRQFADVRKPWAGKPGGSITWLQSGTQGGLPKGLLPGAQLAERIRTGCVYDLQPMTTFGLLVTREDPRTRWRARPVLAPIHTHWPLCAPSITLLTGHETACRSRHCRGVERSEEQGVLRTTWTEFAAAYRAELEQRSLAEQLGGLRQIVAWLCQYPTLTILSFESGMPKGEALAAWEQRREFLPWAQRHIFREWLISLLPLAGPGRRGVGDTPRGGERRQLA
jgi:hypothetical protein